MDNSTQGEVFWDVELDEHAPLKEEAVKVGDRVMTYYPSKVQGHGKESFQYDDGSISYCGKSRKYSVICYDHIPSECPHCNPR
jgi:hypothetical protein